MENKPNLFIICRDGQLDPDFVRQQRQERVKSLLSSAGELLAYAGRKALHAASDLIYEIDLGIKDDMHGTNLQAEYLARKREVACAAIRASWQ